MYAWCADGDQRTAIKRVVNCPSRETRYTSCMSPLMYLILSMNWAQTDRASLLEKLPWLYTWRNEGGSILLKTLKYVRELGDSVEPFAMESGHLQLIICQNRLKAGISILMDAAFFHSKARLSDGSPEPAFAFTPIHLDKFSVKWSESFSAKNKMCNYVIK